MLPKRKEKLLILPKRKEKLLILPKRKKKLVGKGGIVQLTYGLELLTGKSQNPNKEFGV